MTKQFNINKLKNMYLFILKFDNQNI